MPWNSPTMIGRFQRSRWSAARRSIHAMKRGQRITLPDPTVKYSSLATTVTGLNDAYDGRRIWRKVKRGNLCTVTRIK